MEEVNGSVRLLGLPSVVLMFFVISSWWSVDMLTYLRSFFAFKKALSFFFFFEFFFPSRSVQFILLKHSGKSGRRCCAMSWHPSKCPSWQMFSSPTLLAFAACHISTCFWNDLAVKKLRNCMLNNGILYATQKQTWVPQESGCCLKMRTSFFNGVIFSFQSQAKPKSNACRFSTARLVGGSIFFLSVPRKG